MRVISSTCDHLFAGDWRTRLEYNRSVADSILSIRENQYGLVGQNCCRRNTNMMLAPAPEEISNLILSPLQRNGFEADNSCIVSKDVH